MKIERTRSTYTIDCDDPRWVMQIIDDLNSVGVRGVVMRMTTQGTRITIPMQSKDLELWLIRFLDELQVEIDNVAKYKEIDDMEKGNG